MKIMIKGLRNDKHLNNSIHEVIKSELVDGITYYVIFDFLKNDFVNVNDKFCQVFEDKYNNLYCLGFDDKIRARKIQRNKRSA